MINYKEEEVIMVMFVLTKLEVTEVMTEEMELYQAGSDSQQGL